MDLLCRKYDLKLNLIFEKKYTTFQPNSFLLLRVNNKILLHIFAMNFGHLQLLLW